MRVVAAKVKAVYCGTNTLSITHAYLPIRKRYTLRATRKANK